MRNKRLKKNIWIFNHYATSMFKDGGGRHYHIAKELQKKGYNPVIFCANTFHNSKKSIETSGGRFLLKEKNGIPFVFIKTVPSNKNNFKRLMNMYFFYKHLLGSYRSVIKQVGHPDIIYASSVHPLTLVAGIQISKKLNIRCISEIRDLWPEAIFKFSKIRENSILGKLLIRGEKWIYENSDSLIFTKEGDIDYLIEKEWLDYQGGNIKEDNCFYINNGIDINGFVKNYNNNIFSDCDLESNKFKVIYTGAIRPVNMVNKLIEVASYLKQNQDILILIYGSGNELEWLKKQAEQLNLSNIIFKGNIEKKYIPFILKNADLCILNYSQKNYNWDRGNSSNKLFEYFAAEKPVISTIKMGYSPIQKYNCGFEFEGDDNSKEVARKIIDLKYMKERDFDEYKKLCNNSQKASEEFYYSKLSRKLIDIIEDNTKNE